jgi:hypothetical protein
LRHRGQDRTGVDQVADLQRRSAGDAIDQRANFGKADVQLGGLDCGLCAGYGGPVGRLRLDVVVELALRDGVGLRERRVACYVDASQF